MTDAMRSWVKDNQTLVLFLLGQAVAIATAGVYFTAYMVKLETRVTTMETRGAEYTVDRMNKFDQRITVLEGNIKDNTARIERITEIMLREMPLKKEPAK